MASRRWQRALLAVGGLTLVGAGVLAYDRTGNANAKSQSDSESSTARTTVTADVVRRDLQQTAKLTGRLGFGTATKLVSKEPGTLTTAPNPGAVAKPGDVLFRVDEQPVVLMEGTVPAWRTMTPDSSAGADIFQLEANLVNLGFDPDGKIVVDGDWSSATTAAVKRWQQSHLTEQTGSVAHGRVMFGPDTLRIGGRLVEPGIAVGPDTAVASYTATTPRISIDLDAKKQSLVAAGKPVTITFPDGTVTTGKVSDIAKVVITTEGQPGSPSTSTVAVTVTLDDPTKATYDGAAVDVNVVTKEKNDVTAVPVAALLGLAEGGFGVEVSSGTTTRIVKVETGMFADNMVEVIGDIKAGDKVVVPS